MESSQVSLLVITAAELRVQLGIFLVFLLRLCQFSRFGAEISAPCLIIVPRPESYQTKKSGENFYMYKSF